jgi:LysR family transcriptional repressor of citA
MDPRHLRSFVAVAERLHFREAAERLSLSQPTVTGHIQALENEVGAPLFDRQGRRVALTPTGERLLPFARRLLALDAEAEAEVRSWRLRYDERLHVVSSIFVAASVLPGALRRLLAERPRTDVALRTAFSQDVVTAIREGDGDLGFSRLEPRGSGIGARRLLREPVLAVAPAAWGRLGLAEALAAHPLLAHNHPGYWDRLLAQLEVLKLPCQPLEVRQVEVTRRLLAEGLGLSFLPRSAVAEELAAGSLRPLRLPAGLRLPSVGTWALWPGGRGPTPAASRLIDLVAAAAPVDHALAPD